MEFDPFFLELAKKMKEKKIKAKLLLDEDLKKQIEAFTEAGLGVKPVPREYSTPAEVNIYGNKILTVVWAEVPRAWVVENKEIADSYRKFFKMIWGEETRTYKGLEGGVRAFKNMINSMKKTDEWLGYVISSRIHHEYLEEIRKIHQWRGKKGLKSRIIFSEKSRKEGERRTNIPNTKIKYIYYDTPIIVNVDGNVTLLNVPAEKGITVFYIENKQVADSFREQFERIWKQAKK